jgi:murein L,D-transpeptidase YafK
VSWLPLLPFVWVLAIPKVQEGADFQYALGSLEQRKVRTSMALVPLFFGLVAIVRAPDLARAHFSSDRVVINKSDHTLTLFQHGHAVKSYKVSFGNSPTGRKLCEGDNRTPEGSYEIDRRNMSSRYHIALHVSYPNAEDRERARRAGCSAGGDIMIHGIRSGFAWVGPLHRLVNWTRGCIAVTNEEIEEIARAVPDGTPVVIQR